MESFAGKVRDEVLAVEAFDSLLEAKTVIEDWRTAGRLRRELEDRLTTRLS